MLGEDMSLYQGEIDAAFIMTSWHIDQMALLYLVGNFPAEYGR